MSALPIFPGRFQPSIFGANELNYRVRDGNGWTLIAINTDCLRRSVCAFPSSARKSIAYPCKNCKPFFKKIFVFFLFCQSARYTCSIVPTYIR